MKLWPEHPFRRGDLLVRFRFNAGTAAGTKLQLALKPYDGLNVRNMLRRELPCSSLLNVVTCTTRLQVHSRRFRDRRGLSELGDAFYEGSVGLLSICYETSEVVWLPLS